MITHAAAPALIDSPRAWMRLVMAVLISTVGGVGMWSVVVVLPAVQAEFGSGRSEASLPYTLTMVGFAFGGVILGRLADRFGIMISLLAGTAALVLGYLGTAYSGSLWQFAVVHGFVIGVGTSASFSPLLADISLWFARRRGIAVAVCASGNYLAGTVWPPVVTHLTAAYGWRTTHLVIALVCAVVMAPLAVLLRERPPAQSGAAAAGAFVAARVKADPRLVMVLLSVAGVACCVAMSMPQVHIVAYCGDLGYGVARGAEMLSLMLGFGIISRIGSGFIADKIGGLPTLLIGSLMQGVALFLYLLFDGLTSLYVISILFGLFQGGIVPSYAIVIRENFPASQAATRVGVVIMATLFGMALGGWGSGVIYDLTGSYRWAFLNGLAWNLLNVSIVTWMVLRRGAPGARPAPEDPRGLPA